MKKSANAAVGSWRWLRWEIASTIEKKKRPPLHVSAPRQMATDIPPAMKGYRALHYVLKIGDRNSAIRFFRSLRMKVLRHEEFEKGCEATCNGPYDGRWSKTMVGYGPEDSNFVLELTYNYGISSYVHGNCLDSIEIDLMDLTGLVEAGERPGMDGAYYLHNNGYKFRVEQSYKFNRIRYININTGYPEAVSGKDVKFYDRLGLVKTKDKCEYGTPMAFGCGQTVLVLKPTTHDKIDHGTAFGRLAFSCPTSHLIEVQKDVERVNKGGKILTPLVTLDTPGKASVSVVIICDVSSHEICFVGEEGFLELCKVDPEAEELVNQKMLEDKSNEWFAKHGKTKEGAPPPDAAASTSPNAAGPSTSPKK